MIEFIDFLAGPSNWLLSQPPVIGYSIIGILMCGSIIGAGLVMAKLRLSPLWSLLMLAPVIAIPGLWWLAYKKWRIDPAA